MLLDLAGLCRPYCLASSPHRRKTRAFPGTKAKIWRETDCLLEGDGFELPVPRAMQARLKAKIAGFGCMPSSDLALAEIKGAAPVRRPAAVIISDYGLGLAIMKSDAIAPHGSARLLFVYPTHQVEQVEVSIPGATLGFPSEKGLSGYQSPQDRPLGEGR
jgi:hypothetical protein